MQSNFRKREREGGEGEKKVSLFSPMLSAFDRELEMSVMVSALAHVVAGDEPTVAGGGGGGSSSACKRGPQEQHSSSKGHDLPSYAIGGASNSSGIVRDCLLLIYTFTLISLYHHLSLYIYIYICMNDMPVSLSTFRGRCLYFEYFIVIFFLSFILILQKQLITSLHLQIT